MACQKEYISKTVVFIQTTLKFFHLKRVTSDFLAVRESFAGRSDVHARSWRVEARTRLPGTDL